MIIDGENSERGKLNEFQDANIFTLYDFKRLLNRWIIGEKNNIEFKIYVNIKTLLDFEELIVERFDSLQGRIDWEKW